MKFFVQGQLQQMSLHLHGPLIKPEHVQSYSVLEKKIIICYLLWYAMYVSQTPDLLLDPRFQIYILVYLLSSPTRVYFRRKKMLCKTFFGA